MFWFAPVRRQIKNSQHNKPHAGCFARIFLMRSQHFFHHQLFHQSPAIRRFHVNDVMSPCPYVCGLSTLKKNCLALPNDFSWCTHQFLGQEVSSPNKKGALQKWGKFQVTIADWLYLSMVYFLGLPPWQPTSKPTEKPQLSSWDLRWRRKFRVTRWPAISSFSPWIWLFWGVYQGLNLCYYVVSPCSFGCAEIQAIEKPLTSATLGGSDDRSSKHWPFLRQVGMNLEKDGEKLARICWCFAMPYGQSPSDTGFQPSSSWPIPSWAVLAPHAPWLPAGSHKQRNCNVSVMYQCQAALNKKPQLV